MMRQSWYSGFETGKTGMACETYKREKPAGVNPTGLSILFTGHSPKTEGQTKRPRAYLTSRSLRNRATS